jgi:hypothetical protein
MSNRRKRGNGTVQFDWDVSLVADVGDNLLYMRSPNLLPLGLVLFRLFRQALSIDLHKERKIHMYGHRVSPGYRVYGSVRIDM